jgi:hypothetical protein
MNSTTDLIKSDEIIFEDSEDDSIETPQVKEIHLPKLKKRKSGTEKPPKFAKKNFEK